MRLLRASLIPLLLLVAWGCNQPPSVGGYQPPKSFKTVVSLSPSTTELIGSYAMDPGVLKGRTQACNYPTTVLNIPVVCSVKPDYERIAGMKPDLIVYDDTLFSQADIEKLKQVSGDVFLFPMKSKTVDEYIDSVYKLGALLESSSRFSEYVDKVYAKSRVGRSNPPNPQPKVEVLIGGGNTEFMAAGTDGFLGDVIRSSGGEPLGPKSVKFETVSIEALVQANPDLILTNEDVNTILKDPRLATVSAVKAKAVYAINADILLRAGARVEKLIEKVSALISSRSAEMAN
jgi:iron complex transport system substrate-binding protein